MRKLVLMLLVLIPFISGCYGATGAFLQGLSQGLSRRPVIYQKPPSVYDPQQNYSQSSSSYKTFGYNYQQPYSQSDTEQSSEFPFGYNYQTSSDYPNYQPTEFGSNYQHPSYNPGEEPFGHNY